MIADVGYQGKGAVTPHRRKIGQYRLPAWKETTTRPARGSVLGIEHVFAWMKNWKIPRDCRLKGSGVAWATGRVANMHDLALNH